MVSVSDTFSDSVFDPMHTATTRYPIRCQSSASFTELIIQRCSSFQYGEMRRMVFMRTVSGEQLTDRIISLNLLVLRMTRSSHQSFCESCIFQSLMLCN